MTVKKEKKKKGKRKNEDKTKFSIKNLMKSTQLGIITEMYNPKELNEKLISRRLNLRGIPPVGSPFNKTYKIPTFFTPKMCSWVINESEEYAALNGGWTTTRHKNYPTTDLPIKLIKSLSTPLMNMTIKDILPLIARYYSLNIYYLNVVDIFIVKYEAIGQNFLDFHRDGSIVSFNILLNEDFEGGGTIVKHIESLNVGNNENEENKEKLYENKLGDLFIHPGMLLHSGKEITLGVRYLIVGFIDYCKNLIESIEQLSEKSEKVIRS